MQDGGASSFIALTKLKISLSLENFVMTFQISNISLDTLVLHAPDSIENSRKESGKGNNQHGALSFSFLKSFVFQTTRLDFPTPYS